MSSSFNEIGSEMNNDSALDLFELKYLEEISFLFNVLKGMDNYFGLDLFEDNYCDYFDFIQNHVVIHEFNDDILSEEDSEINIYDK